MQGVRLLSKRMPLIGLGTSKDKNVEKVREALRCAFKAGYRMVDTAPYYMTETHIGEVIQEAIDSGLITREDIFVVIKLPEIGAQRVRKFLKSSLENLKLDYVDLYLIHCPAFFKHDGSDDNFLPMTPDGKVAQDHTHYIDVWKDMERCVDEGLCRSIGVSNFNEKQLEDLWKNSRIKPSNLQNECHVHLQEESLLKKCQELGVTMTAYAPLGCPSYDAYIQSTFNEKLKEYSNVLEEPVLRELAKKHKKTPAQIALRWLVQRGIAPIPKSFSEARIIENIQIFDFSLTGEDMQKIGSINKNIRNFTYKQTCKGLETHPSYPFQ